MSTIAILLICRMGRLIATAADARQRNTIKRREPTGICHAVPHLSAIKNWNISLFSVASRTRQYGIMRAIGMGVNQLYKMIAAEAFTYAILGCIVGCVLGLPLNRLMFQF